MRHWWWALVLVGAGWAADPILNGFEPSPGALWHAGLAYATDVPLLGDFDGDGKQDAAVFVRTARAGVEAGDVLVALSNGSALQPARPWARRLLAATDLPLVADFDGNGRADVAFCVREARAGAPHGSVWVAVNYGDRLGEPVLWHEHLCVGQQVPVAADFNNDKRADLAVFVRDHPEAAPLSLRPGPLAEKPKPQPRPAQQRGNVFVALSQIEGKHRYFDGPALWHASFCVGGEVPLAADVDGNGRADLLSFGRGAAGTVQVALAGEDHRFGAAAVWQDRFCIGQEVPAVGDVDGDGRADLVTFLRSAARGEGEGDVYVALSRGARIPGTPFNGFGRPGVLRHGWFGIGDEVCLVGDVTGDQKADLVTFTRGAGGAVYGAKSTFGQARNWQLRLENLRVVTKQEGGGDEPYLIVMPFRSRFSTAGSTRVDWGDQLFELGDSLRNGAVVNIPERMGLGTLNDVVPITVGDIFPRLRKPEVLGAVVICMESDGTPFGTVGGLMRRGQEAMRAMLARLVESRPLPTGRDGVTNLINDAQGSMQGAMNAIRPSIMEGIGAWLSSFGDPDDFIGFHVFLYMSADPEVDSMIQMPGGIPSWASVGRLQPQRFRRANNSAIVFEGDSAKYDVEASLLPVP